MSGRRVLSVASEIFPLVKTGGLADVVGALPVPGGDPEFRPEIGMGEADDAELLPSGVGLVWRALVLWLLLVLLLTLAYWAPGGG